MFRILSIAIVLSVAGSSLAGGGRAKPLTLTTSVDGACVLYLSDGSAWEIRPENRPKASNWAIKSTLAVYKTEDREFPFRLVLRPGKPNGEVVAARRLIRYK